MRRELGAQELLFPMPVLIIGSYDEEGKENAMNAAWGGISNDREISLCLSPEHKSVANILGRRAFTVSVGTEGTARSCDYVGLVSGGKVRDKCAKAGFTATKSSVVDAPLFDELPFALECSLVSWDEKNCRMVGKIENISADESILDAEGKVSVEALKPLIYDPSGKWYYRYGERVAKAFSVGRETN